ncbi:hypothetical protein Vretifemale_13946 [Volvox reticuliferus]|uniref:Glycosyltransferase 2-like domain-containing protein n=1 Tax=Volvox reticuliferus TaxID=1737510 RepID=A0A8J4CQ94_9CHLO|nr:hypothetical protein Vretifemale_13946 [Volvox reticuliferus]
MGHASCKEACVENGSEKTVRLSVVIPALNESSSISAALASVSSAAASPIDVVVVDGGSTDDTVLLARRHGAKVIRTERGRGRQLNTGWRATRGDWCLFLHSDSKLPPRYDELIAASVHRAQLQQQQRLIETHDDGVESWAAHEAFPGNQTSTYTSHTLTSTPVLTSSVLTRTPWFPPPTPRP